MALARCIASEHIVEVLVDPAELQKWTVETKSGSLRGNESSATAAARAHLALISMLMFPVNSCRARYTHTSFEPTRKAHCRTLLVSQQPHSASSRSCDAAAFNFLAKLLGS